MGVVKVWGRFGCGDGGCGEGSGCDDGGCGDDNGVMVSAVAMVVG